MPVVIHTLCTTRACPGSSTARVGRQRCRPGGWPVRRAGRPRPSTGLSPTSRTCGCRGVLCAGRPTRGVAVSACRVGIGVSLVPATAPLAAASDRQLVPTPGRQLTGALRPPATAPPVDASQKPSRSNPVSSASPTVARRDQSFQPASHAQRENQVLGGTASRAEQGASTVIGPANGDGGYSCVTTHATNRTLLAVPHQPDPVRALATCAQVACRSTARTKGSFLHLLTGHRPCTSAATA